MKQFKILVKSLDKFIKTERVLFAASRGQKLYVTLHAGPNVKRYIVTGYEIHKEFSAKGDAVRFFNSL